jgi:uncharacterized protein (DUF58 family)
MPRSSKSYWSRSKSPVDPVDRVSSLPKSISVDIQPEPLKAIEDGAKPSWLASQLLRRLGFVFATKRRFFVCLILAIVLHIHAAFSGNDWVYLLASGFAITCLVGFIWPALQLFQMTASGALTEEALKEDDCRIQVFLRRTSKWPLSGELLPLRLIWVSFGLLRLRGGRLASKKILQIGPLSIDTPRDALTLNFPAHALSRGVYEFEDIQLSSGFPFGLTWWTRTLSMKTDHGGNKLRLTIYAKSVAVSGNFLIRLKGVNPSVGLAASNSILLNRSSLVREIREYRAGDSPRHVHWPISARFGKLMVREFDSEILPSFNLYLDLHAFWRSEDQFELAVLSAQSLAQMGLKLGFLPELILNPPIDSELLADLMSDIPVSASGLDLICEILARVTPLPPAQAATNQSAMYALLESRMAAHPLIALQAGTQTIMKHTTARGNYTDFSVELVQVLSLKDESRWTLPTNKRSPLRATPENDDKEKSMQNSWSLETTGIATIYSDSDLTRL